MLARRKGSDETGHMRKLVRDLATSYDIGLRSQELDLTMFVIIYKSIN